MIYGFILLEYLIVKRKRNTLLKIQVSLRFRYARKQSKNFPVISFQKYDER